MSRWREPTRSVPLRWGTYLGRYLAGLLLIVAGYALLDAASTYVVGLLLFGTATHVAGWFVLPARGGRRIGMMWLGLLTIWLCLTGPQILFVQGLLLLGWLVVRQRPLRSFVVLVIPVGVGILLAQLAHTNRDEPWALTVESLSTVAAAWIAWALARTKGPRPVPAL